MQVTCCSPAYDLSFSHLNVDGFFVANDLVLHILLGVYLVWGCL